MRSQDFFKLLQNQTQGPSEILSNYFKNRTKGTPEVLNLLTSKIKQEGPRDFFFQTILNNARDAQHFFKLL